MAEKTTRRRLAPVCLLVTSCFCSLIGGVFFGKHLAEQEAATHAASAKAGEDAYGVGLVPTYTERPPYRPLCLNTCSKAKDGACDDGRWAEGESLDPNKVKLVLCDLGTDCDDCGPWTPSGPVSWRASSQGPVALLRDRSIELRVKNSTTLPPFTFAYTDPKKDFDVSAFFDGSRMVERSITSMFTHIFKRGCRAPAAGKDGALFLDVGANFGWFSLLAAAMGCRVIAYEPVPHFYAFFEYSTHLNGFAHRIDMRRALVSNVSGVSLEMVAPSRGIWGTAGINGLNIDSNVKGSSNERFKVPSVTLDKAVLEDVLLLKVDVEGWEWSVMQGASKLLPRVQNIVMEYSPGVPERHFRHADIKATVQMLVNIIDAGFRIGHIGDLAKHAGGEEELGTPPAPMEEVTRDILMYDLVDADAFGKQKLGCPIAPELRRFRGWAVQCGLSLPEDVSPHSLRSVIGHNTNLFASRGGPDVLPLNGTVGIIKLSADPRQYFVDKGVTLGMGSRFCEHIEPLVQVRHRCPCTVKATCGEEEGLIQRLANAGKVPTNYRLKPGTLTKVALGGEAAVASRRGGRLLQEEVG